MIFKNLRIWFRSRLIKISKNVFASYEKASMTEHFFMIFIALIIGVVAGVSAVMIRYLVVLISDLSFPGSGAILNRISDTPWYLIIIIPTLGGLIVGIISKFSIAEAKGHGVPEVITALLERGGIISPFVAFFKSLTSSITIGSGGSVGNEGPMVQIGASIGSTIGQFFKVNSQRMKTLVGCGVAAGIAGTFNVPVAGALFAIEVVLLDYGAASFLPIIIASSISTVISNFFVGNFTEFTVEPLRSITIFETGSFFVLGALCGLVSYLFIKTLYTIEKFSDRYIRISQIIKPALGGLIIGIIGIHFPQIMGVGNDSINLTINNQIIWYIALLLVFIKIISTSITLASGGSGGVLSPALFIGAMLGSFYGDIVNMYFPKMSADANIYALVAMGGLMAGIVRAPLTSIIIVFELTQQTTAILPLMMVSTISLILSQKLSRESIYTLRLVSKNIKFEKLYEINILKNIRVRNLIDYNVYSVPENAKFNDVANLVLNKKIQSVVVNSIDDKEFMGIISINSIRDVIFDKEIINDLVIAGDIADRNIEKIFLDDNCMDALKKINNSDYYGLPVFAKENPNQFLGFIWLDDINQYFHRESDLIDSTMNLADKLAKVQYEKDVSFIEGHQISEIEVPKRFINKSIRDLKIRNTYEVEIISIKKKDESGSLHQILPKPEYIFEENDFLIITGESEKVNILKHI